jgi:hypothetical protein
MVLDIPELDDRRYADLVQEALGMLPQLAPEWTNHNPTDPGITLIELLAWFSEMLLYRLNRISRDAKLRFLDLLRGPSWEGREPLARASIAEIDNALRLAALALREPQRAVSAADYETLALRATADAPPERRVVRAFCAARRNLEVEPRAWETDRPGHVSLVLVPEQTPNAEDLRALTGKVQAYLESRRLLGTRLHVVGPRYLRAELRARIHRRPEADPERLRQAVDAALARFFSPLPDGGPHGEGWPFGRAIHLSEIYAELDRVPGVDWVDGLYLLRLGLGATQDHPGERVGIQLGVIARVGEDTRLGAVPTLGAGRLLRNEKGRLITVALRPHELASVHLRRADLSIVD